MAAISPRAASPGSVAPKTAEPATNRLAPVSSTASIVSAATPPSTSRPTSSGNRCRARAIFGSTEAMNFWPLNPGLTVIIRAKSMSPVTSCNIASGVAGFNETPALQPAARICDRVMCKWVQASAWMHPVRTRLSKIIYIALGSVDHQVHVENAPRFVDQVADTLDDNWPDGDIGNELTVHDIHVDYPDAYVHHPLDI